MVWGTSGNFKQLRIIVCLTASQNCTMYFKVITGASDPEQPVVMVSRVQ